MHKSGGLTARNPREGFRSEYIAEFVFSAFGTAVITTQGNDIGIDLLCNLTSSEGNYILVKSSYGVQVKSKGYPFEYKGEQATKWLKNIEFPLLLASIDKDSSNVKIYSAWNLNRYLLGFNTDNESTYPKEITFITSNDDATLPEPNIHTGEIPVGKAILDFNIQDLGNEKNLELYHKILNEWLSIDNRNYLLRRGGISCVFGYVKWETNKSLDNSQRIWYKPYFYSPFHTENAKRTVAEAFVVLGLYLRKSYETTHHDQFRNEFNNLRSYAFNHLSKYMEEFSNKIFENEI